MINLFETNTEGFDYMQIVLMVARALLLLTDRMASHSAWSLDEPRRPRAIPLGSRVENGMGGKNLG
jgi:hypothetical protein